MSTKTEMRTELLNERAMCMESLKRWTTKYHESVTVEQLDRAERMIGLMKTRIEEIEEMCA